MVCKLCGTENPNTNKFCGECGALLVDKPAANAVTPPPPHPDYEPKAEHFASILGPSETSVVAESVGPTVARREVPVAVETRAALPPDNTPLGFEPEGKHYTTISGPSFLGLTDDSSSDESTDYLLEDEERSGGRTGWYVFSFVAIAILATIGLLEWRAIKTGKLSIPFFSNPRAEEAKPAEQPPAVQDQSSDQAATPTTPQSASEAPWGDPQAKPDTDHSANVVSDEDREATTDAQSRLAKQAEDARSKAVAGQSSAAESTPPSASKEKPTETATAKEPSTSSRVTSERKASPERPAEKRVEKTSEKPDPKQNQMLIAGEKYLYGRGVPRDCSQALIYFRAAAGQGNAPAMSHLGALYASGECTRQNRTVAYTWFRRAQNADPNNEWIAKNMNMVWRDMTPQERAGITQ